MARGIRIGITRMRGCGTRCPAESKLMVWGGTHFASFDSAPYPPKLADLYHWKPAKITTWLMLSPPDALPMGARGYPRTLPRKSPTNDNRLERTRLGRAVRVKDLTVHDDKPAARLLIRPGLPLRFTLEEMQEAFLRAISRDMKRHLFRNDEGTYGYINETGDFVSAMNYILNYNPRRLRSKSHVTVE